MWKFDQDWSRKLSQKEYVDAKRHAVANKVEVGDWVLLRNTKTNKLSLNYNPSPCKVIDRKGGEVTVRSKTGVDWLKQKCHLWKSTKRDPQRKRRLMSSLPILSKKEWTKQKQQRGRQNTQGQLVHWCLVSRLVAQVHFSRWVARDQLKMLDYLNDFMTMNCLKDSWTLFV